MKLKNFDTLWKFYPKTWSIEWTLYKVFLDSPETPRGAQSWISQKIKNSSVIKICYALNSSVNPIRPSQGGLPCLIGKNGYFLLSGSTLAKYLQTTYGNPDVETIERGEKAKQMLAGKQGILCFEIPWGNATIHFALWNGSRALGGDYFNHAGLQKVLLWEVSP